MREINSNNQFNEHNVLSEFQTTDAELAQALLRLRQSPNEELKKRVRAISNATPEKYSDSMVEEGNRRGEVMQNPRPRISPNAVRFVIGFAGLFTFMIFLLASVPDVRAEVGQMLQRFGIVLTSPESDDGNEVQPLGEGALVGRENSEVEKPQDLQPGEVLIEQKIEKMSLEEAQQILSSDPPMPTWLPENIVLSGVRIGTGPYSGTDEPPLSVVISYEPASDSNYPDSAGLGLQITYAAQLEGGYAFPLGKEQEVMIHEHPGIFVKGSWWHDDTKNNLTDLEWRDDTDAGHLAWSANGLIFNLSASGLGLSLEDFIRIAESIEIQQ